MNCCESMMKTLFGLVNLAIFLGGCGVLGIGIYSLTSDSFGELIDVDLLTGTAILLIVAGCLVVFVAFFGCCGAFKESKCMLGTFFCLMLVLFVLMAAGAIIGFVAGGDSITDGLRKQLTDSLDNYYKNEATRSAWDNMQTDFECCGVDGKEDYPATPPKSCGNPVYQVGCLEKATDFIDENSKLFGGIAIVVAAFLFLSMVFSCCIRRAID